MARTEVAIAVVEQGGMFLVGQRPTEAPLGGLWEFPGGKIEDGETAQQAAARECREETGMEVEVLEEHTIIEHDYPHGQVRLHFLACRPLPTSNQPLAPFVWMPRQQLGAIKFPEANHAFIKRLLQQK